MRHHRITASVISSIVLFVHFASCSGANVNKTAAKYPDGRPAAALRMEALDQGVVLRHGDGPNDCDKLGARDVWVFETGGAYYMHYDAAGPKGWLASLAVSKDGISWEKKGPILDLGAQGEDDSASASYGTTYFDGAVWHMFYLGTPNVSPAPNLVPSFPYLTMKAKGESPRGPWTKQKDVVPFRVKEGTYYDITASPGFIVKNGEEYMQFLSTTQYDPKYVRRTLSIARTRDLNGSWTVDPAPLVPVTEQIENSSLYFEEANQTWFLFTNHIGLREYEYTDAIWVYWTKDLNRWDPAQKAVVLDFKNCMWSKVIVGLPSVLKIGDRLAVFYDGSALTSLPKDGAMSHMHRDVGLAWLDLPLGLPR